MRDKAHVSAWIVIAVFAAASGMLLQAQGPQAVGTWAAAGNVAADHTGAAFVPLEDGRTLIVGGIAADATPVDTVSAFDPADNTSTVVGTLSLARAGAAAAVLADGRVLVAGGIAEGGLTADVEIFDPASGSSQPAGALGAPRTGHAAASLANGTVLIVAGSDAAGEALATAEVFDPNTASAWPVPMPLHYARTGASATLLIDGRVLVAGGNNGAVDLTSAEIYDPIAGTFVLLETGLSVARSGHTAVLLPHNNSVLVAGGTSDGTPQAAADLFLPAEFPDPYSYGVGTFAATAAMTHARAGALGGPGHGEGYTFVAGGGSNEAEQYRFPTIKTDKDDYAPGERAVITGTGWRPGETVRLLIQEDPAVHDDYALTATADANGNLYWDQWRPETHDLGVRFYLTARQAAAEGERIAQTTFTDANVSVNPQRFPTVGRQTIAAGQFHDFTASVTRGGPPSDPNPIITGFTTSGVTGSVNCGSGGAPLPIGWLSILSTPITVSAPQNITIRVTVPGGQGGGNYQARYRFAVSSGAAQNNLDFCITVPSDSTPPVITPHVSGTLGSNGWYTSDVDVSFTVADGESTITSQSAACTTTTTVSTDTADETITCTASSGGGTASESITIKRDASPPLAPTGGTTPAANAAGWNDTDVTVGFDHNGDVGPSGVAFCTASTLLTAETTGTSVDGFCTDHAGNVSPVSTVLAKIDKTEPVISGERSPAANAAGWNNTDVTVTFACADTGAVQSGVAADTVAGAIVDSDGANQSVTNTGVCADAAGNAADPLTITGISVDKTAPNPPTASRIPAATVAGWNNTDVTVSFSSNGDNGPSGVASCSADSLLTEETGGTNVSGTCTDNAGNVSATATLLVKIDKTRPTIIGSRYPEANSFGWNNTEVVVSFVCVDSGMEASGIVTNTVAGETVTAEVLEGAVSNSGACMDAAGNEAAQATISGISIDKTAPNPPSADQAPAANANGWNSSSPVTVSFASGGDAGAVQSGIDSCTGPDTISGETAGTDVAGTCTDKAGNTSQPTIVIVRIDQTKPVITGSRTPAANAFGWNNTDITVSFECSDALSGLAVNTVAGATATAEGAGQSVTNSGVCTDLAGHAADPVTIANINIDKTAPNPPTGIKSPAANAAGWNNTDVTVSFQQNGDTLSGIASCTPPSLLADETSGTDVHGSCTDRAGNVSATTTVHVNIDKTAPAVALLGVEHGGVYVLGAVPVPSCSTTDTLSGVATPAALSLTGGVAPGVGSFTARCDGGTDAAGNVAPAVSATFQVQYAPAGATCNGQPGHQVLQPINFTGSSVFNKRGSGTVPAKFRVCGADGISIGPTPVVSSFVLYGTYNGTVSPYPNEDPVPSTTPDAAFRWSAADQQWIFNMDVKNLVAGTTYVFRIYLNDGTPIQFQFGIK